MHTCKRGLSIDSFVSCGACTGLLIWPSPLDIGMSIMCPFANCTRSFCLDTSFHEPPFCTNTPTVQQLQYLWPLSSRTVSDPTRQPGAGQEAQQQRLLLLQAATPGQLHPPLHQRPLSHVVPQRFRHTSHHPQLRLGPVPCSGGIGKGALALCLGKIKSSQPPTPPSNSQQPLAALWICGQNPAVTERVTRMRTGQPGLIHKLQGISSRSCRPGPGIILSRVAALLQAEGSVHNEGLAEGGGAEVSEPTNRAQLISSWRAYSKTGGGRPEGQRGWGLFQEGVLQMGQDDFFQVGCQQAV